MSHWARNYIGLPHCHGGRDRSGLDCWGLVTLVYEEVLGIMLPELPGITTQGVFAVSREIATQRTAGWTRIERPIECGIVGMSHNHALHHVGIWTDADGGKVIHCWKSSVVADTLDALKRWKGIRTLEFYCYGLHR